jgi:hypothetical protein
MAVTKKATRGPTHRVPCPHCGKPNDLRKLAPTSRNAGWGANMIETGNIIDCDHCGKYSQIARVQSITVVTLRQHNR